jgi:pre-mRNA-splicing factor RBM22/SLT11
MPHGSSDADVCPPCPPCRFKKTVICREVALAKNVCQCCILDLETGLPVGVRDAALGKGDALPQSEVGKEYVVGQIAASIADGTFQPEAEFGQAAGNELLRRLARTAPYYKRNRARICTFWLRNACSRTDCPFRPCNGDTDMPELKGDAALRTQNIRDRYNGTNDPVAEKMLRRAAEGAAGGALTPPEDTSVTTLFVGGLDERVDEGSLRDHMYLFGSIASVRVVPERRCAFVTYATRAEAEAAALGLGGGALVVKGLRLKLMWGKPVAKPPAAGGGAGPLPPPWAAGTAPPASSLYPSMDAGGMGSIPAQRR